MVEAVGGAVLAGEPFVTLQRLDVGGVFDLAPPVERAPMGGECCFARNFVTDFSDCS